MATSNRPAFDALMAQAQSFLPDAAEYGPGDLGRASIEAMTAQRTDPREAKSTGWIRLTGAGVRGHLASLEAVGKIASSWQRLVTSVGASLEGAKSARGPLSEQLVTRTRLALDASPAPGSVMLNLQPLSDAEMESAPNGQRVAIDAPRPIADLAAERALEIFREAASTELNTDGLEAMLKELGPRVASSLQALTATAHGEFLDLELEWREPEQPTRRALVSAGTAGWLASFVSGRNLEVAEEIVSGVVRTVSDLNRWVIDIEGRPQAIDATELDPEFIRQVNVRDTVSLVALVRVTHRPDGGSSTTMTALRPDESAEVGRIDEPHQTESQ